MAESRLCSIPGCNKPFYGRGWCNTHYARWVRTGDPLTKRKLQGEVKEYFSEVVLKHDSDECLFWPFANTRGYAVMGKKQVHRLLCEEVNGPAPSRDHHASHSCGNGHLGCVAKRHLAWKTPKENNADKHQHGTVRRGIERPNAKLNEQLVRTIKSLRGSKPANAIAQELGVSLSAVRNVFSGNSWAWVE